MTKNIGPWIFASVLVLCLTTIVLVLIFRGETSEARGVLGGTLGVAVYVLLMYGGYRLIKEIWDK